MIVRRMPIAWLAAPFRAWGRWLARHGRVQYALRILRLGLFQFAVGLSLAPITGTLNRVLIDELAIPAVAVGFLIAIHYFVSPVRAVIGFRSDQRRAAGHWRTPYLVFGMMLTYGGLACAPFALILLSGEGVLPFWPALLVCALIFLAYGVGVNIVETIYLALVSDITPPRSRGQVLAVLWIMLVLGTVASAIVVSLLLQTYSHERLIRVMQGSAVVFVILSIIALWQQERLRPNGTVIGATSDIRVRLSLRTSLQVLGGQQVIRRLFAVLCIATIAFATHDVLLEPYGGQVLQMSVAATTQLTALFGAAMLVAIALAGWLLWRERGPLLVIGLGCGVGALGFALITVASEIVSVGWFRGGVALIGLGRGLFIVGSVALVMSLTDVAHAGLFLGLWGMMQAIGQGTGVVGGSLLRDVVQRMSGSVVGGYAAVYGTSLGLLAATLLLVWLLGLRRYLRAGAVRSPWAGLQDLPADQMIS